MMGASDPTPSVEYIESAAQKAELERPEVKAPPWRVSQILNGGTAIGLGVGILVGWAIWGRK